MEEGECSEGERHLVPTTNDDTERIDSLRQEENRGKDRQQSAEEWSPNLRRKPSEPNGHLQAWRKKGGEVSCRAVTNARWEPQPTKTTSWWEVFKDTTFTTSRELPPLPLGSHVDNEEGNGVWSMAGSVTWAIPGGATSIRPHIEEGNPGERTASQHSLGKEGRGEPTHANAEGLESASTRGGSKAQP